MKRAYLAGPMRGYEHYNFPAFDAAAAVLRADGWEIFSPAEIDREIGFDEKSDDPLPKGFLAEALRRDTIIIADVDNIILLPGWQESSGANYEMTIARTLKHKVFAYVDGLVEARPGPLVGLAGRARSGKDTVGNALVEGYGFRRFAFADKVKQAALALDPLIGTFTGVPGGTIRGPAVPHRLSQVVKSVGMDDAKMTVPEVRRILQYMGTEAGREIHGVNLWTEAIWKDLYGSAQPTVITDVRFPNEVDFIRNMGGVVVRLTRESQGLATGNTHASEAQVDGLDVDLEIVNDSTPEWAAELILRYLGIPCEDPVRVG